MFQFNAKFAFHVLQISLFYFWSMFCLKRIAQIFACRAVNIQIEFLAAKYLRNVLAGARWCYTRWYHVSTHQSWYVIYNCTPIIIPRFLAPAGRHTIYILSPLTFRYLVRPGNIDVNCHPWVCLYCSDVSLLHCLPIPAASPRGVKGVMMALFTQLSVRQSLAKL